MGTQATMLMSLEITALFFTDFEIMFNALPGKVVQVHAYSIFLEYSEAIRGETLMVVICQIRIEKRLQI